MHEAAYLLAVFTLFSQVLGLVRSKLLAHFVAAEQLDFYFAAFRIPDLIFVGIASLVSISVLIPFLTERIERNPVEARQFLSAVFTIFFGAMVVVGTVALIFAPLLADTLFPGFTDWEISHRLVPLIRVMLLSPILLGMSSIFASVTQVYRKFFLYAASPILYNIGIIVGVIALYPRYGLTGLACGVVLGALLHLLVQLPFIASVGFLPRFSFRQRLRDVGAVFLLSLPRTAALSVRELSILVLFSLASLQAAGSIAVFQFASELQAVPLGIVGVSYSMAAFPTLARLLSQGDRTSFFAHVETGVRHIIFWALPASALFIVLRAHVVRVIYGSGKFGWLETRLTAATLAAFAFSIVAQSLVLLFSRAYYAAGNTKKPLIANVVSAIATVGIATVLLSWYDHSDGFRFFVSGLFRIEDVPGANILVLPIAYSVGQILNVIIIGLMFAHDFGAFHRRVAGTLGQSIAAAVIGSVIAIGLLRILDEPFDINTGTGILLQGFLAGMGGIIAGIATLYGLGSLELSEIARSVRRRMWHRKPLSPGISVAGVPAIDEEEGK